MQQSNQIVLDTFVNYIKNINVHFQSLLVPNQSDFKNLTNKTIKLISDFDRFVGEYNKKVLEQIKFSKLTVPLIFYRTIKDKISDGDFMKYRYRGYELKYVIIKVNLQCHMHVEITKNDNGRKRTSVVFQKYQNTFIYWLDKIMDRVNNQVSLEFFQKYAMIFLQEIFKILNGQNPCRRCRKVYSYSSELKILLPPTIRTQQLKEKQQDNIREPTYLHQQCLMQRPKQSTASEHY